MFFNQCFCLFDNSITSITRSVVAPDPRVDICPNPNSAKRSCRSCRLMLSQHFPAMRTVSAHTHNMTTNLVQTQHRPQSPGRGSRRAPRAPDWKAFYRNGLPKEVIVIEDSPDVSNSTTLPPSFPVPTAVPSQSNLCTKKRKLRCQNSLHATLTPQNRLPRLSAASNDHTDSDLPPSSKRRRTQRGERSHSHGENYVTKANRLSQVYHPPRGRTSRVKTATIRQVNCDHGPDNESIADDADGHLIVVPDQVIARRYRIEKLLGQGTFGKVVQAYDSVNRERVALKVIRSIQKYRDAARIELRVLQTLQRHDPANMYRCIHSKDCFEYKGHICITMRLLGSSIFDFLKNNGFVPFPNSQIQSIAHQLLTSVAYMHDIHIIHTDLKPENILLRNASYQAFTYNRKIPSATSKICRTATQRKVLLNTEICVIDFGSATFEDEYHSSVVSTRHYRAPEIILGLEWSYPCDIWSVGCILVELFTGDALFQTHDNREHLAMMEAVCASKIDASLARKANSKSKSSNGDTSCYFKRLKLDYPVAETTRSSRAFVRAIRKLPDFIPPTNNFLMQFLDLLQKMLVFEPGDRITAKQALAHPWFSQQSHDDGTEAARLWAGKALPE